MLSILLECVSPPEMLFSLHQPFLFSFQKAFTLITSISRMQHILAPFGTFCKNILKSLHWNRVQFFLWGIFNIKKFSCLP